MKSVAAIACLLLASCTSATAPNAADLPKEVHGGWKLQSKAEIPAAQVPGFIKSLGLAKSWNVVYEGPTTIRIEAHQLNSSASAFQALQLWRRDPERAALHKQTYFLLIGQDQPNRNSLSEFVAALDKAF